MSGTETLASYQPATDGLVASLTDAARQVREHDHNSAAGPGDLFCLNLTSFMGERMGPVLRRLSDAEVQRDWLLAEATDEVRERFFATRAAEQAATS
jgi:hypothetical protein